jgi:hypothetical protein
MDNCINFTVRSAVLAPDKSSKKSNRLNNTERDKLNAEVYRRDMNERYNNHIESINNTVSELSLRRLSKQNEFDTKISNTNNQNEISELLTKKKEFIDKINRRINNLQTEATKDVLNRKSRYNIKKDKQIAKLQDKKVKQASSEVR